MSCRSRVLDVSSLAGDFLAYQMNRMDYHELLSTSLCVLIDPCKKEHPIVGTRHLLVGDDILIPPAHKLVDEDYLPIGAVKLWEYKDKSFCPEGLQKEIVPRAGSHNEFARLDRNVVPIKGKSKMISSHRIALNLLFITPRTLWFKHERAKKSRFKVWSKICHKILIINA
ncbi:hypothetical protein PHYBLDRAFT_60858 [Phycomyces blakesleeanus NRRL 1555(-)]|uniref:Uncharacterized protein n=1 Tax=Phycomyces blakesleeanus (strain ATCC 8743b / DSM 1359 / FGSC 10004 / NBRC 33097 / NRRL 1555) TaxID=763407 RepID=A0A167PE00_PHYB8|nr:hypothetical protein PHYBLDRAFT_60858 [Phycomyces blakesleeanus NRRL 1555(-)]OAD77737.1 hypothetical protein PHYBLDRAFT_60858 [Phycomyces blakesleeanus NRRL 1555(-)]|eukprot:XP_018295777.1 hypothetical protein PHYBLDRAFT_60858 [Phycomyces blakesleeanus NRRL 1555(-)]